MGSEVSSHQKSSSSKSQIPYQNMAEACVIRKPLRSILTAEYFYCPFINSDENGNTFFKIKESFKSEAVSSSIFIEEPEKSRSPWNNPEKNEDAHEEMVEDSKRILIYQDGYSDQEIDDMVDETFAVTNKNVGPLELIYVDPNPTESLSIEESKVICTTNLSQPFNKEAATGNSQPTMMDCAVGNSQPNVFDCATGMTQPNVMDCATGMSQPEFITVDCGTQTSQEFPCSVSLLNVEASDEKTEMFQYGKSGAMYGKKTPIVSHRVCCQTTAPVIPAKIPRLNELDRNSLNPIYSSSVTFGFVDESDKENDRSVLRQRGNVGKLLRCTTSNIDCDIADDENTCDPNANPSSSEFISTRGPFLRVGLSKRSRTRNPLHQRSFGNEHQN